ncbi:hypothetical protein BGZ46_003808 [Entomortierella lignicola]|nr:hypothetical protein BGZ46_003808 [Entomortierella lignicola]
MARISSLHTSEKQRSNPIISLQNRSRHVSLFAAILLAMPLFAQVVSGQHQQEAGTRTIPREEETVQIFSPPSSAFNKIDFHGVTIPFSKLLKSTEMVQTSGGLGLGAGETLEESSSSSPETSSSHRGSSRNGVSRVNLSIYPPKDVTPDVNSPQVKAWVAEIDWSKVPNIPVATSLPDVIHFPKCPPMNGLDRSTCWWSCAGCIAPDDIVACPSQDAWGLTYDDGPSLATKDMIAYLNSQGLTATFFIVGSRVLEHADILKNEIAQGHHIGMHSNLNLIILRPAVVYGIGAMGGLTPRLICGRVYMHEKKKMEFLWTKDLRINTVHVDDVTRAIWYTSNWYVSNDKHEPVIFNLADENDTDQEAINTHIRAIFGIETGFQGTVVSQFAKLNMKDATEEINELHLAPWSDLLKANKITTSPLTPYLDQELLLNNALSLDGTKITTLTGFTYDHPKLTTDSLKAVILDFQELGIWPRDD